jgi:NAD(P)H-dependent FMN reductase
MTRILLITGGTSEGSLHTAALRTAVRLAPADLTATLYDGLRGLPAFVPGEQPVPAAVARLRDEVAAAGAVLFSTPEYAGSLPGSLKNLLDWLVDGGDLHGKPAAWLSVAAPGQDESALGALQTALSFGNARLLRPACIRVPLDPAAVDAHGTVTDPQLHRAVQDILQSLVRSADAPRPRAQPSWQAYSSVFPVVMRRDASTPRGWRPPS